MSVVACSHLCKPDVHSQGELHFRQSPTFQDCYPGSEKCYTEIEHNGSTLRVGAKAPGFLKGFASSLIIPVSEDSKVR